MSTSALSPASNAYGSFAWTDGTIIPTVTNSGYSVTFTPSADTIANYEPITTTTANVAITVNKAAAPVITWPTSATPITYGQTLADATLNVISDANGVFDWTASGTAPTVAQSGNSFSVTYTPNDTDNYDYSTVTLTANVPVTVNQAVPDGTPEITEIMSAGKTLADAALTSPVGGFVNLFDGSAVAGTLEWVLPLNTPVVQGTTYQWTFTPDDAVNYDVKSGGMILWPMATSGTTAIPVMGPMGLVLLVLMLAAAGIRYRVSGIRRR